MLWVRCTRQKGNSQRRSQRDPEVLSSGLAKCWNILGLQADPFLSISLTASQNHRPKCCSNKVILLFMTFSESGFFSLFIISYRNESYMHMRKWESIFTLDVRRNAETLEVIVFYLYSCLKPIAYFYRNEREGNWSEINTAS